MYTPATRTYPPATGSYPHPTATGTQPLASGTYPPAIMNISTTYRNILVSISHWNISTGFRNTYPPGTGI
jgi:hypothetical protein